VQALFGMDQALTLLFALLAGLGGLGYIVSLGVSLYANVERKQREMSLLRLIGVRRGELTLFTVLQATAIGAAGALLAAVVALAMQAGLNAWWPLGDPTQPRAPLALILPGDLVAAVLCSMAGAAIAALVAGLRAASVQPAEGMRYG
jgi:putative ABC transport system permease protein